jgi:hypothetical protein
MHIAVGLPQLPVCRCPINAKQNLIFSYTHSRDKDDGPLLPKYALSSFAVSFSGIQVGVVVKRLINHLVTNVC